MRRHRPSGIIAVLVGLAIALAFVVSGALLREVLSGSQGPSRWRNVLVDGKLGWKGVQADLKEDASSTLGLLAVGEVRSIGTETGCYVLYYPKELPDGPEMQNGVMLARIAGLDAEPQVSTQLVQESVFCDPEEGGHLVLTGLVTQLVRDDGRPQAWYIDPGQRLLVKYDPAASALRTWALPADLQGLHARTYERLGMGLAVGTDGRRVHLAFSPADSEGLYYATYGLDGGGWAQQRLPGDGGWPQVLLRDSKAYVLALTSNGLVLFEGPAEPVDSDLATDAGGLAAGQWSQTVLSEAGSRSEFALIGGEADLVAVVELDWAPAHIHVHTREGDVWHRELVKHVFFENVDVAQGDPVEIAPSGMVTRGGEVHVACFDPLEGEVQHVWKYEGDWVAEPVARARDVSSTAITEAAGGVAIAYADIRTREVRMAWRAWAETPPRPTSRMTRPDASRRR